MFGFIKYIFLTALTFFSCGSLKIVSVNNQECKGRPDLLNINFSKPSFYPFSILVNKWSDSCNNINDSYGELCVSDVIKDKY